MQQQYPELASLSKLPAGTVLDGEVVVLEGGRPSLARLQQRAQVPLKRCQSTMTMVRSNSPRVELRG